MSDAAKKRPWYDRLGDWAARQPVYFEGVRMKDGKLSYRGVYQPVAGTNVTVDTAGAIRRRATVARTVAGGLLAGGSGAIVGALLSKEIDDRELYLIVNGPRFDWSVKVNPDRGAAARAFAAKVNTASRK